MARLWRVINGEPYMINPHLGVIGLNPKKGKKKMAAKKHGARHMAWVRSFRKKGKKNSPRRVARRTARRVSRRKSNPYPMGGAVVAMNPRRRRRHGRKRNPARKRAGLRVRGFFGLPPVMPIVYASAGFIGSAGLQGFIWGSGTSAGMIPAEWKTNADGTENKLTKYAVLIGSLLATTWIGKMVFGPGPAALAGIGSGLYVVSQAAHDFIPGTIPGMNGPLNLARPLNLAAYTTVRPSGNMGAYTSLRAPDYGAARSTRNAAASQNIVAARFRRFQ